MKPNFNYIEEKATAILKKFNLYEPGFDIKELTKSLDIKLIYDTLADDVAGFFVMTDNQSIITINRDNKPVRKRFTIAHEIGHSVLHSKEQPIFIDKTPKVMFRNIASSTGEIFKEREANAFAAALLMPKELIEQELQNAPNDINKAIRYLADTFNVSENAMSFRLSNLGYGI